MKTSRRLRRGAGRGRGGWGRPSTRLRPRVRLQGTTDASTLEIQVHPGHQQEVLGSGLDGARPRREQLRKRIAHRSDAQLVARFGLLEETDDIERAAAFAFGVVEPGEGRWHSRKVAGDASSTQIALTPGEGARALEALGFAGARLRRCPPRRLLHERAPSKPRCGAVHAQRVR